MLLKIRNVGESDRSKIEDQLCRDKTQSLANLARLDFVNQKIDELEKRRATSSPHVASETVWPTPHSSVDMTIAGAIRHYQRERAVLERRAEELSRNYDKHCQPLNELNRRQRLIDHQPATPVAATNMREQRQQPAQLTFTAVQ